MQSEAIQFSLPNATGAELGYSQYHLAVAGGCKRSALVVIHVSSSFPRLTQCAWIQSVPPRGSGWVKAERASRNSSLFVVPSFTQCAWIQSAPRRGTRVGG